MRLRNLVSFSAPIFTLLLDGPTVRMVLAKGLRRKRKSGDFFLA